MTCQKLSESYDIIETSFGGAVLLRTTTCYTLCIIAYSRLLPGCSRETNVAYYDEVVK